MSSRSCSADDGKRTDTKGERSRRLPRLERFDRTGDCSVNYRSRPGHVVTQLLHISLASAPSSWATQRSPGICLLRLGSMRPEGFPTRSGSAVRTPRTGSPSNGIPGGSTGAAPTILRRGQRAVHESPARRARLPGRAPPSAFDVVERFDLASSLAVHDGPLAPVSTLESRRADGEQRSPTSTMRRSSSRKAGFRRFFRRPAKPTGSTGLAWKPQRGRSHRRRWRRVSSSFFDGRRLFQLGTAGPGIALRCAMSRSGGSRSTRCTHPRLRRR